MRFQLRFPSLASRLFLFFGVSSFVVLLASSAALYHHFQEALDRAGVDFLEDKQRLFLGVLSEKPSDPGELAEQIQYNSRAVGLFRMWVRQIDAKGRIAQESPEFPDLLPRGSWQNLGSNPKNHFNFLIRSSPLPNLGGGELQLALDQGPEEAILGRLRRVLLIVLLSAAILLGFAGAWIISDGLKPLEEISAAMHRITVKDLQTRLNPEDWPSELRGLSQSFNKMLDRLDESFRNLSQFSAELAHELRTPLHAMRTQAEVTLSRPRSSEDYVEALQGLLDEATRLSSMTENLLFLAKSERRQEVLKPRWIEAEPLGRGVVEYFEAIVSEKGIKIECIGSCKLWADELLFRRALSNLISNALKFSPESGRVVLEFKKVPGEGQVRVLDSGPGIKPSDLDRVTEARFRSQENPSITTDGLGLGLAIVASIVRFHGGKLELENHELGGLLVTMRFPEPSDDQ